MAKVLDPVTGALSTPDDVNPDTLSSNIGVPKDILDSGKDIPMYGPGGDAVLVTKNQLSDAIRDGYKYDSKDNQVERALQKKYGDGASNEAKAFLESAASGATFGLSDVAARTLGGEETRKAFAERRARNKGAAVFGGLTGGLATSLVGPGAILMGGLKNVSGAVASNIVRGVGLGATESLIGKGIAGTIRAAIPTAAEGAAFGAGTGISEAALDARPPTIPRVAETIISNAGLGALIGGSLGVAGAALSHGVSGAVKKMLTAGGEEGAEKAAKLASKSMSPEDLINGNDLAKEVLARKANAEAIERSASNFGLSPEDLPKSFTSPSSYVQKTESEIAKANTYPGRIMAKKFESVYNTVDSTVETNLFNEVKGSGFDGGIDSKVQAGQRIKQDLEASIKAKLAPIEKAYQEIESATKGVPLNPDLKNKFTNNFFDSDLVKLEPKGPYAKEAKRWQSIINNADNVNQISKVRSQVNNDLSSAYRTGDYNKADFLQNVKKNITAYREEALKDAAMRMNPLPGDEEVTRSLLAKIEDTNKQYAGYKDLVSQLAEGSKGLKNKSTSQLLGKIRDLTPEEVSKKLFNVKDVEHLQFLKQNFPNEFNQLRVQELARIREASMQGDRFHSPKFLKETSNTKMSPETRKLLFGDVGETIRADADTIYKARPAIANPSGTASAFDNINVGEGSITGQVTRAIARNARDYAKLMSIYGFDAIEQGARKQGITIQQSIKQFLKKGEKAVSAGRAGATVGIMNWREKDKTEGLDNLAELAANPELLYKRFEESTRGMADKVPDLHAALGEKVINAVNFLQEKAPKNPGITEMFGPHKYQYSDAELAKFNRYVKAISNPISIMQDFSQKVLTPESVEAVRSIFPEIYSEIQKAVMDQLSGEKEPLTLQQKQQASILLGVPTASYLNQDFINSMQKNFQGPEAASDDQSPQAINPTQGGIGKVSYSQASQTGLQRTLNR